MHAMLHVAHAHAHGIVYAMWHVAHAHAFVLVCVCENHALRLSRERLRVHACMRARVCVHVCAHVHARARMYVCVLCVCNSVQCVRVTACVRACATVCVSLRADVRASLPTASGAEGRLGRKGVWGGREPGTEGSLGRKGVWSGKGSGAERGLGRKVVSIGMVRGIFPLAMGVASDTA